MLPPFPLFIYLFRFLCVYLSFPFRRPSYRACLLTRTARDSFPDAEAMLRKLPRDRESMLAQSSKLRCLSKMLPALVSRGHRILVFSQGVKMLDLTEVCVLKPQGIKYLRIDGQSDAQTRTAHVRVFQNEPDMCQVLLLTTGVGGYGLNLTAADRVIILDPAWNPAVDMQAL